MGEFGQYKIFVFYGGVTFYMQDFFSSVLLHKTCFLLRAFKFADNLLLTANQKNIKLIDFGLAREETVTEMMTAETGTYRWMAPEVVYHQVSCYLYLCFQFCSLVP